MARDRGASKGSGYAVIQVMTGLTNALPTDVDALQALILAERAAHAAEATRLRQIIKEMQRHRFGRRAETLPIDQLELGLEDVQQSEAGEAAAVEAKDPKRRSEVQALRRANRGQLPGHLPRIETILDIEDKTCPCCAGALHVIGENRAERLDVIPARFQVLVVRRPRYGCRT